MSKINENRKAILDRATFLRGRIIQSYSQVEFLIIDLVLRAEMLPEYRPSDPHFPYKLEDRLKRLERIAAIDGPLSGPEITRLAELSRQLRQYENLRHFMAHGAAEVTFDRNDNHVLRYVRYEPAKKPNHRTVFHELVFETTLVQLGLDEHSVSAHAREMVTLGITLHNRGLLPAFQSAQTETNP